MLGNNLDSIKYANVAGLIAEVDGEIKMITIDQIDTPNSAQTNRHPAEEQRSNLCQFEAIDMDSIKLLPPQGHQNLDRLGDGTPPRRNWLSRAWRLLTNSFEQKA